MKLDINNVCKFLGDYVSTSVAQMNSKILNVKNEEAVKENATLLLEATTNNIKQDFSQYYIELIIGLHEDNEYLRNELNKAKNNNLELLNIQPHNRSETLESKSKKQNELENSYQKKEEQLEHESKLKHEYNERRKELESSYWRKEDKQIEKYCEKEIELENSYKEKEKQLEFKYYKKQVELEERYRKKEETPEYGHIIKQIELKSNYREKEEQLEHKYKKKELELEQREMELQQREKHFAKNSNLNTCYCKAIASTSKETIYYNQTNNNACEDMAAILVAYIAQYEMAVDSLFNYCNNILEMPSDSFPSSHKLLEYCIKNNCNAIRSGLVSIKNIIRKDISSNRFIKDLRIIPKIEEYKQQHFIVFSNHKDEEII
ncbi:hypothetical protein BDF19DRAFT_410070 [Syncephalis fuscata]|nr:hypothetical protein BDF19DRAFT_410070 [Syncephalis fuscata]